MKPLARSPVSHDVLQPAAVGTIVLLLCLVSTVASAADSGEPLKLPVAATAAALNPETGDVAIVGGADGQVWILPPAWFGDPNKKPAGPLATAKNPVSVLFKRYQDRTYLVVGCFDQSGIIVLDATTREIVGRVPRVSAAPTVLVSASTDSQDPWVYLTARLDGRVRLGALRPDVPEPALGWLATPGRSSSSSGAYVVSSSGRWLYGIDENRGKITKWSLHKPSASTGTPTAVHIAETAAPAPRHPLVRLPFDQGLAQGTSILPPAFLSTRPPLLFYAACAVDDRPFLIGLANRDLRVASLLTGKLVARTLLPRALIDPTQRTISVQSDSQTHRHTLHPIVLADSRRDRIVVLVDRHANVIPMSSLNLPNEPILAAALHVPDSVFAGEDAVIEVKPGDPRVQVELVFAPKGMRLDGDKLVWKPTFQQLGLATFALRLRYEQATARKDHELSVVGRSVSCPLNATHVAIDDTGKRLAVWRVGSPSQLALIDLATPEAVATCEFADAIVAVAMTGETLCVLTRTEKEASLLRLDPRTLETRAEQTIRAESSARYLDNATLTVRDGNVLALQTRSGVGLQYSLPDLKNPSDELGGGAATTETRPLRAPAGFIRLAPNQEPRPSASPAPVRQTLVHYRSRELRRPSDPKQRLAPVTCDAFPVRLGVRLETEAGPEFARIDLVARPLMHDDVIHSWPVGLIDAVKQPRDLTVCLSASGSTAVLLFNGRAYVKDLAALADLKLTPRLRLTSDDNPVLGKLDGKTRLRYAITGGKEPHTMDVKLNASAGSPHAAPWASRVPDANGQFDVDVPEYVSARLSRIAWELTAWSADTTSADSIMAAYTASVAEQYEKITGQPPAGVPIAIPVVANAYDGQGQTQRLDHDLLADVPRKTLELEVNVAVAKRWKGTVTASEAEARAEAIRDSRPSPELIQHSRQLRQSTPRAQLSPQQLEAAAREALAKFEQRWQQALDKWRDAETKHPLREWVDGEGHSVKARLDEYFAGQVILSLQRGQSLLFAIEDLSEADQTYVREATAPPNPEELARREEAFRRRSQLRRIGAAAFHLHEFTYRRLPPLAIVSDEGQPLVSWRVLLLPFLGGQELFGLFHFDEPWDSEHNRRLADFVPSIYRLGDVDVAPTHTPIVRLTGPQTASPPNRLIRPDAILDAASDTLFAVVTSKEHAVVWTKPDDLPVDAKGAFIDKLDWRNDQTTVLTCDGNVSSIDRTLPSDEWLHRGCRNDGQ